MNDFSPDPRPDPIARARDLGPAIEAAADEIERTQRIPENALVELGEREGGTARLEQAEVAHRAALEELTRDLV